MFYRAMKERVRLRRRDEWFTSVFFLIKKDLFFGFWLSACLSLLTGIIEGGDMDPAAESWSESFVELVRRSSYSLSMGLRLIRL